MKGVVSVIIVNHNGKRYLDPCLTSLLRINRGSRELEVILVDNVSTDGSVEHVRRRYPTVKIIRNDVNNYARALNIGIASAAGDEIALLNNDTVVDQEWLNGLLDLISRDSSNGAVQSKILFSDGKTINSVGATEIEDFYFKDIGFGEKDEGQYEHAKRRDFISGGSVLYRRACLEDVGSFDEDLFMFFEDIDYSIRCRERGWKLWYSPRSVVYHVFHGTTTTDLCERFCSRNRLLLLARYFPHRLVKSIKTSHDYNQKRFDRLYWSLIHAVKVLVECHDVCITKSVLKELKETVVAILGAQTARVFFSHIEVVLGLRMIRMGIYDHAFHFAGGGQRYVAKAAEILQDRFDITYIGNKEGSLNSYKEWFGIDLSKCRLKIIRLPHCEEKGSPFIDEGLANNSEFNYLSPIIEESANYDLFLNANMLTAVEPLSPLSIFMCHFPDREKGRHFSADRYDYILANGCYTSFWIGKKWGLAPTAVIYPPVDMYHPESTPLMKEKIILSVARFEIGGSKKQLEMVKAFAELSKSDERVSREWTLMLAGGSHGDNPYLEKVRSAVKSSGASNITVLPNLTSEEIKDLYRRAAIFWHACGLDETRPDFVEHFGMTTVEAMQNYCVPIVIDGGGQREIVEDGKSGYRFSSLKHLKELTLKVIMDEFLRQRLGKGAYERSHCFTADVFRERFLKLMSSIENRLRGAESLDAWNQE